MIQQQSPIKLFYSYAHSDEEYRNELEKHLSTLRHRGVIKEWFDRKIVPSDHWGSEISKHLEEAHIILLLVSVDFLNSTYCFNIEMKRALERHELGEAIVIPIILRACGWQGTPFSSLLALPKDGKPVKLWDDRDEAWVDVIQGIESACQKLEASILQTNISSTEILDSNLDPLYSQLKLAANKYIKWYEGNYKTARKYVELDARNHLNNPRGPLFNAVNHLLNSTNNAIAILGEFGTGKTTFARHLVYVKAREWLENPESARLPILLRLYDYDYRAAQSIEEWIVAVLRDSKARVIMSTDDLKQLIEMNRLILVFDGFDEMTGSPDADRIRRNQNAIGKLRWAGSSIVVTCRTTFFEAAVEEAVFETFSRFYIEEMTNHQFIDCVRKTIPNDWEKFDDFVKNQSEYLQDLVKRPLFIDMLIELDYKSLGKIKNVADLYYELTDKWIGKQSYRSGAQYDIRDRRTAIEELAYKMLLDDKNALDSRELEMAAKEISIQIGGESTNTRAKEIDFRDISNYTFLKREQRDKFRFSHHSFMEYFVASKIARELEEGNTKSLEKRILYEEIYEFLAGIFERDDRYQTLTRTLLNLNAGAIARVNTIPPLRKQRNKNAIDSLLIAHIQDPSPLVRFVSGYTLAILLYEYQDLFSNSEKEIIKNKLIAAYQEEGNSFVRLRMAYLITDGEYHTFEELNPSYDFDDNSLDSISIVPGIMHAYERVIKVNREHEYVIEESIRILTVYCILKDENADRNIKEYRNTLKKYILKYGAKHDDEKIRRISIWSIGKLDLLNEKNDDSTLFQKVIEKGVGDGRAIVKAMSAEILSRFRQN